MASKRQSPRARGSSRARRGVKQVKNLEQWKQEMARIVQRGAHTNASQAGPRTIPITMDGQTRVFRFTPRLSSSIELAKVEEVT